jgi:hypothetical protein
MPSTTTVWPDRGQWRAHPILGMTTVYHWRALPDTDNVSFDEYRVRRGRWETFCLSGVEAVRMLFSGAAMDTQTVPFYCCDIRPSICDRFNCRIRWSISKKKVEGCHSRMWVDRTKVDSMIQRWRTMWLLVVYIDNCMILNHGVIHMTNSETYSETSSVASLHLK